MSVSIATDSITSSSGSLKINANITANNLSDVAYTGNYNDLIGRPSDGGSIVESWNDGQGNWYKKYDDGLIEQCGISQHKSTNTVVSLNKQFSSSNYVIALSIDGTSAAPTLYTCYTRQLQPSQFTVYINGIGDGHLLWYASGF